METNIQDNIRTGNVTLLQGYREAVESDWEPPSADCPLRCPNCRKISKLTVKVYACNFLAVVFWNT